MGFKKGEGRQPINLMESHIRYAMEHTKSNRSAAAFLNVSYPTYKKYAQLFVDSASGKSLFVLHMNKAGKGMRKANTGAGAGTPLKEILEGMHPNYNTINLKRRLLRSGLFEECCAECGFSERRITDYTVPLLLDYIDGDNSNKKKDNLRFLCYNHYYLLVGNPVGYRKKGWSY